MGLKVFEEKHDGLVTPKDMEVGRVGVIKKVNNPMYLDIIVLKEKNNLIFLNIFPFNRISLPEEDWEGPNIEIEVLSRDTLFTI